MVLNLINLYSLIIAQFGQISPLNDTLEKMKENETVIKEFHKLHPPQTLLLLNASLSTTLPSNMSDFFNLSDTTAVMTPTISTTLSTIQTAARKLIKENGITTMKTFLKNCTKKIVPCNRTTTSLFLITAAPTLLPDILQHNTTIMPMTLNTTALSMPSTSDFFFNETFLSSTADDFEAQNFSMETDFDDWNLTDITAITKLPEGSTTATTTNLKGTTIDDYEYDYSEVAVTRHKRGLFEEISLYQGDFEAMDNDTDSWTENSTDYSSTMSTADFASEATDDFYSSSTPASLSTIDDTEITEDQTPDMDTTLPEPTAEPDICYEIECYELPENFDSTTMSSIITESITTVQIKPTENPSVCILNTTAGNVSLPGTTKPSKLVLAKRNLTDFVNLMDESRRIELNKLCWETMFGQELVKLTVFDLVSRRTMNCFSSLKLNI